MNQENCIPVGSSDVLDDLLFDSSPEKRMNNKVYPGNMQNSNASSQKHKDLKLSTRQSSSLFRTLSSFSFGKLT